MAPAAADGLMCGLRGPEICTGTDHAKVAAHRRAADQHGRAAVAAWVLRQRDLGAEVARGRLSVDVDASAGRDSELDIARDALHRDAALARRTGAEIARDRLHRRRATDRASRAAPAT